jgi:uroporphyrinogen decarboxylase
MKEADFGELLSVLSNGKPSRPTLFELFMNEGLYAFLAGEPYSDSMPGISRMQVILKAFRNAGYDYATVPSWITDTLVFAAGDHHKKSTISLNEGAMITDRPSFESYPWPRVEDDDYSLYEAFGLDELRGMRLIAMGPCGILENIIALAGFENLCLMVHDDPGLVRDLADAIGSRLLAYYRNVADLAPVGACIVNDDWGFKTQTMLSPDMMREYVFPWQGRIVDAIHSRGKPAILHSCGNLSAVMEDIIVGMGFDAKHSFEDAILPVEDAYESWGQRVAILGGIDMDFLCRMPPEAVRRRSREMLERAESRGGYALGSGNSIPSYVPFENYFAMISAAAGGQA